MNNKVLKQKNIFKYLFILCIAFLSVSCSKNPFIGTWQGSHVRSSEYVVLGIEKNGNFRLYTFPSMPEQYWKLCTEGFTKYEGTWELTSDNEIELNCTRYTERPLGGKVKDFTVGDTYYLRLDGALCKNYKDFASPFYNLIKDEK